MLFLWKLGDSDLCEKCKCREDLFHAFLECRMNKHLFGKLVKMVRNVYKIDLDINICTLLKSHKETKTADILTIAFWSIYNMIILRNECGKDERGKRLCFF